MKDRGSATVEFALLIPLLIVVIVMLTEVVVVARLHIEVVAAAREGARAAAIAPDPDVALKTVRSALGERAQEARVGVHRPHVVGADAKVTVSLAHRIGIPFFDPIVIPVQASAVMRVER